MFSFIESDCFFREWHEAVFVKSKCAISAFCLGNFCLDELVLLLRFQYPDFIET